MTSSTGVFSESPDHTFRAVGVHYSRRPQQSSRWPADARNRGHPRLPQ